MKSNTGDYSNLSVSIAKERVREDLLKVNKADIMFEIINKPVRCRCGAECIVRMFENQWFINYGDKNWKDLTNKCLNKLFSSYNIITINRKLGFSM